MAKRSDLSGGISLRFTAAGARARELAKRPYTQSRPAPLPLPRRRVRVVGDPQTSLERFMLVLDAHELLGVDGYLADDVVLISVGDHFDYPAHDGSDPRSEGIAILRWLAEHSPDQVPILLGNHDASRVMELARVSDADFARLRSAALELVDAPDAAARWAALTDLPTPGLVARDYAGFAEAQRKLVVDLLLAGRYSLGVAATLPDGHAALVSHAGVTVTEVEWLGGDGSPTALAAALARRLADAVDARRAEWTAGTIAPLDLAPLHRAGVQPREGGGLLYHRPSERPDGDGRRFHPRELPRGLVQVAGHSQHRKNQVELASWAGDGAEPGYGVLRTLTVDGDAIRYEVGVHAAPEGAAVVYLVDAGMNEAELEPELVPLFELGGVA